MKKPKTDQLLKGIVGTSVALFGLTACSTNSQEELFSVPEETNAQATAPATPPSPDEADCDTWIWDEEGGVYQCVQEGSENYGHYYSGGSWFPTVAAFMAGQAIGRSGSTNANLNNNQRRQEPTGGSTTNQQSVNQNYQNNQTMTGQQTSRSNTSSNQVTNSRSGMGSGGTFGG